MRQTRNAGIVLVLLVISWMAATGFAQGINTTDPSLPPNSGDYVNGPGTQIQYNGAGLVIILRDIHLHPFASGTLRTPSGPDEIESFTASLSGQVSVNASPFQPANGTGPEQTLAHNKIGNTTGTFATEMLQLNLSGTSPFGPFMLRESPTLVSPGSTKITDIGGGLYHIDSFFDVFTELSVDGGQNWIPSSSGSITLTLPEPGVMGIMVGVIGLLSRRNPRRRRSQGL